MVKPIPDGYPHVIPYLSIAGAAKAIEFYSEVFGAKERMRMPGPPNQPDSVGHAELEIGNSMIMLADEYPDMGSRGPKHYGGSPVTISVYVEDVDATFERAIKAGAKEVRPLENQFYGDRTAVIEDPFGHSWHIASHVEDVSEEEMTKRMAAMGQGG